MLHTLDVTYQLRKRGHILTENPGDDLPVLFDGNCARNEKISIRNVFWYVREFWSGFLYGWRVGMDFWEFRALAVHVDKSDFDLCDSIGALFILN